MNGLVTESHAAVERGQLHRSEHFNTFETIFLLS
jgi:hypothetical protein